MRKVAIYGGSFNPVHFGHIGLSRWVLEHTDTDEVWLMVSPNNPLKDSSILADEQERLKGVEAAIEEDERERGKIEGKRMRACDFEFRLPRPSYTVDTLRALMEAYQDVEFRLLIGEDNWMIFDRWKEWKWILEKVEVLVYPRKCMKERCTMYDLYTKDGCTKGVKMLEGAPYFDISSTEIREKRKKS